MRIMFFAAATRHKILAFLLPFALLISCFGCVAACTEITNQETAANNSFIKDKSLENDCGEISGFPESCPFPVTHIALQKQQTDFAPLLINAASDYPPFRELEFPLSIVRNFSENQHSPPRFSPPLYLSFCNLRI